MRIAIAMIVALGLTACASASPDGGVASYDALRQAHEKCAARGGALTLKTNGNARDIQDYACKGA